MFCQILGHTFAWLVGLTCIALLVCLSAQIWIIDWFPTDTHITWVSTISTLVTAPIILLFATCIQRKSELQMFTWVPIPIAGVTALWLAEDVSQNVLQEMLQAAFAATFIGVAFDTTLQLGILKIKNDVLLWVLVALVTILSIFGAYLAALNAVAAFSLGMFATFMNIVNIPHISQTRRVAQIKTSTSSSPPPFIIIPLVWILLTATVLLQEFEFYREAGILSNAPCMHFIVAFMLWWTSTHDAQEDLADKVLHMIENIGMGSVAVFSSAVFTAIFWQGLTHLSMSIWWIFVIAVTVSLSVSLVMFYYTRVPSVKEQLVIRKREKRREEEEKKKNLVVRLFR